MKRHNTNSIYFNQRYSSTISFQLLLYFQRFFSNDTEKRNITSEIQKPRKHGNITNDRKKKSKENGWKIAPTANFPIQQCKQSITTINLFQSLHNWTTFWIDG